MTNYYIIGSKATEDQPNQYWNSLIGWTEDFDMAHSFNEDIVNYPLPDGTTSIMIEDFDEYETIPLTNN